MQYINTILNSTTAYGGQASQLTNHLRAVYSQDIYYNALPMMYFLQFAQQKTELGTQPGLTIQMMTYADLKRGSALTEGTPMGTQALGATMKSITIGEHGNAVSVTELALQASFTNLMADIVKMLSRNVAMTIDCDVRDVAMAGATINSVSTPNIYGRANNSTPKVNQKSDVTSAHILSVAVVQDAVELLATANCPKINNSYYVAVIHPHQSRNLRNDPAWQTKSNYAEPDNYLTGEIGRIDDVRFVETTLIPNGAVAVADNAYDATLDGTGNGGIDLYKAIIMGEDYYGFAVGLPVELRDGGVIDFGRSHAMGWYSIYGCAVLNPERAVLATTA